MDFKKEYSLHKNFNDACSDYRWRTRQNDDFKKAMKSKNIEYFNSFKNGILCITIFSTYTSTLNSGIPFIKDYRVVCFYDDFIAFSQKRGFDYTRGIINYNDVEELSVLVKGGLVSSFTGFDTSSLIFFLNNKEKIIFGLRNYDSAYILSQIGYLGCDNRFPLYLAGESDGRYIFIHK
jgi:hypothetical protein